MRLSEAIRLGAMLKPQVVGSGASHGSCALRAAADALGIPDHVPDGYPMSAPILDYAELLQRYPWLSDRRRCPIPYGSDQDVLCVVYMLNDVHKWTRERIADWVATIEPPDEIEETLAPVLVHQEQGV